LGAKGIGEFEVGFEVILMIGEIFLTRVSNNGLECNLVYCKGRPKWCGVVLINKEGESWIGMRVTRSDIK